jgi:uncharacterized membrane protein YfcA
LASGVLNGATSMGGPPVVLYLHRLGGGAYEIRARLFSYFALSAIPAIPLAWAGGVLGAPEAWQAAVSAPLVLGGVIAGRWLLPRLGEAAFRRGTLTLLAGSSAVAIVPVVARAFADG